MPRRGPHSKYYEHGNAAAGLCARYYEQREAPCEASSPGIMNNGKAPAPPTKPSPGAGGAIREVGIGLCLKESDGSETEKYEKRLYFETRMSHFP